MLINQFHVIFSFFSLSLLFFKRFFIKFGITFFIGGIKHTNWNIILIEFLPGNFPSNANKCNPNFHFYHFYRCYSNTPYLSFKWSKQPTSPLISGAFRIQEDQVIEERIYLKYYIWTPIILFLIAGLFHCPYVAWHEFAHEQLLILFKGNF